MKNVFKKITVAVCAALTSVIIIAAPVLANSDGVRPMPGSDGSATTTTTTTTTSGVESSSGQQAVSDSTSNAAASTVTAQASASAASSNRYLTKWGGFFWFLFSVIVNFVLSCWIGNRFYRMARKSAQSSNEVRALRKDIEEKFASTIKDIDEPAIEVINSNESYARDGEGIAMPERKSHVELTDEEREMMRSWDAKRASSRTAAVAEDEEDEDDYEESRRPARRSYQPTRRASGIEFEDDEDEEEEEKPARARKTFRGSKGAEALTNAKNKAKDFLSNVFPFDE